MGINISKGIILTISLLQLSNSSAYSEIFTKNEDIELAFQQKAYIVKGKVLDSNQQPIIGANIIIEGTSQGTITDLDGNFSLQVLPTNVLKVSYIGYVEQSILINNQAELSIILKEDTEQLDEVVVTALGIQRKTKVLSYNVQDVKAESLTQVRDANFINSLNGKIAGVTINSSSSGIGGGTRVVMRGAKSISKSNNTLYVVDGVPLINNNGGSQEGVFSGIVRGEGISDFNPDDIESLSVLTGPAAAALYGSMAANGAVIITTKKGKSGKVSITLSNNTEFSKPFVMPRFQNKYGNKEGEFSSWGALLDNPSSYSPSDFFQTATNVTNSFTLSAGNDANQTFLSASTTNANGLIPNNEYNRYNFSFRNSANLFDNKLQIDLGASYVIQNDKNMIAQGQYFNPIIPVYLFPRGDSFDKVQLYERYDEGRKLNVQYWPYGDQGMQMQNPYWITNRNLFGQDKDRYMFNVNTKYNIRDWLNVTGRVRVDNSDIEFQKKYYASTSGLFSGPKGFYAFSRQSEKQMYADFMVNINKSFDKYSISANIGTSYQDSKSDLNGYQGPLLNIPNFFAYHNIDRNGRDARLLQEGWHERTKSVFANVEFGYNNMLFLTLTGRNDWTSMLANSAEPSFFYPSVGLSALVSEMVKMPDLISFLKVRGSFSSVGSSPQRYLTIPTFSYDPEGNLETNTFMPIPKLKAERTKSYEAGLNLKMFKNVISLDLTYYKSNTYNQTFKASASPSSGYSSFYIQAGNVQNQGLETSLGLNLNFGDLSWNPILMYSFNRNKIIELVNNQTDPITGKPITIDELVVSSTGTYRMILKEGGQIGDIYTTTDLRRDNQGDVYIDPGSGNIYIENKLQKVGTSNPKGLLSFRNNFEYKGFNLGVLFTARLGGEVVSATQAILDKYGVSEESAQYRDNGGIPINNGFIDPEYYYSVVGGGETGMLSKYVYSATNVRLQELVLGYNLPKKWFNDKLNLNVFLTGKNLWMIYNKAPFDPELTGSTGTYYQGIDYFMQPSMRSFGLGFKIQY